VVTDAKLDTMYFNGRDYRFVTTNRQLAEILRKNKGWEWDISTIYHGALLLLTTDREIAFVTAHENGMEIVELSGIKF
jgi:hypothetical protein